MTPLLLALLLSMSLAGCSPEADNATAEEIVDAWADAACYGDSPRVFPGGEDGDGAGGVVTQAVCDVSDDSMTLAEGRQFIAVYDSATSLGTKLATVDCTTDSIKVTGDFWYSSTSIADVANALQDDLGGELQCP